MEKDILHLKLNALVDVLNSKGLIMDQELKVINESILETAEVMGHDKERVKEYLFE